jgi:hypothetical protein
MKIIKWIFRKYLLRFIDSVISSDFESTEEIQLGWKVIKLILERFGYGHD